MIKKIKFWLYCQSGKMEISNDSINLFRNKGNFTNGKFKERT